MTAQIHESLKYNDNFYSMATEPLEPYLELINFKKFSAPHTGCWRGYYGAWEIKNNQLFLTELKGFFKNSIEVNLQHLFPDQTEVFAYWFSGLLNLPQGKLLKYIHVGYSSIYEKTQILEIENGNLISITFRTNTIKENDFNNDDLPF
jgi:hypothetical protein